MLKLVKIDLIYVTETTDEQRNPIEKERKQSALAREKGTFSSYYYQSDNDRNMNMSNNFEFDKELLPTGDEQIRYIVFNDIRYKVINLLTSKDSVRRVIADVERIN